MTRRRLKQSPAPAPAVSIIVPEGERLSTIAALARSVETLAKALSVPTSIAITGCHIQGAQTGIEILSDRPRTERHDHFFRPPA